MNDSPVQRLTAVDLINLYVETPAALLASGAPPTPRPVDALVTSRRKEQR